MNREIPHHDDDEKDIRDVRREEMSRGRRPPIDTDQEEKEKKYFLEFRGLLRDGDRKKFKSFLIARGQQEGTEEFVHSMNLYDQYQKDVHRGQQRT